MTFIRRYLKNMSKHPLLLFLSTLFMIWCLNILMPGLQVLPAVLCDPQFHWEIKRTLGIESKPRKEMKNNGQDSKPASNFKKVA
jgi:hypothetical protein